MLSSARNLKVNIMDFAFEWRYWKPVTLSEDGYRFGTNFRHFFNNCVFAWKIQRKFHVLHSTHTYSIYVLLVLFTIIQ